MNYPDSSSKNANSSIAPAVLPSAAQTVSVSSVTSEALLGSRGELKIQHNGELYSLRRTRQGKLILTK